MLEAAEELHNGDNDNIVDVAVSCDGTWQRRGYASHNGVVSVISMDTRKVIDIEAMNKSCKKCEGE